MSKGEENGFLDIFVNWVKGRIESPFIIAFVTSWALINRDFIFLLMFYSGNDKHLLLSSWDFSKPSDFFGMFNYTHVYYRTLILPFLYAVTVSVILNPVSLLVGAIRYFVSSFFKALAESAKTFHANFRPWCQIKALIRISKKENTKLQFANLQLRAEISSLKKVFNKETEFIEGFKKAKVLDFIIKAMKFEAEAAKNSYQTEDSQFFGVESLITYSLAGNEIEVGAAEFMEWLLASGKLDMAYSIAEGVIELRPSTILDSELKKVAIKKIKKYIIKPAI